MMRVFILLLAFLVMILAIIITAIVGIYVFGVRRIYYQCIHRSDFLSNYVYRNGHSFCPYEAVSAKRNAIGSDGKSFFSRRQTAKIINYSKIE